MPSLKTRARRLLGELSYAQSRSFELRTGIPVTGPAEPGRRHARRVAALETLWDSEPAQILD